jgi:hypothetical protein
MPRRRASAEREHETRELAHRANSTEHAIGHDGEANEIRD